MEYNTEWAEALGGYFLDYRKDGQAAYNELLDLIRNACDGAFNITGQPNCRYSKQSVAIKQIKELPWEYIFDCMKTSGKDFEILPTDKIKSCFGIHLRNKSARVFGWYDETLDAIHIFSYTGRYEEEEDTLPGYDGYGRFDTYYQIVEAWVARKGEWVVKPKTRYVSLYVM